MTTRSILPRYHLLLFAALLLIAALPYYAALAGPFTDDDWIFLYHTRGRSLWGCFSPRVVWFWRPLHCALFSALWRVAELNPVPYNVAALGLFFIGAALWSAFFVRLTRAIGPALLTMFLFLVSWQYCDAVFWKSNFGTLLAWIGTAWVLLVVSGEWRVARSRKWIGVVHVSLAFVFALLAKESAVNIPFLAALVWAYRNERSECELQLVHSDASETSLARRSLLLLGPLFALLAAYLAFHRFAVVDIEQVSKTGYGFVGPLGAARQYLLAMNHLFFFFDYGPFPPGLNGVFNILETRLLFIPLLLWAWAAWRRDGLLAFALALASIGLLPGILLENYNTSRFYLLPAGGMALAWAVLIRRALAALQRPAAWAGPARIALVVLIGVAALRSWMQLDGVVQYDLANSRTVQRFQQFIVAHRSELPPDACLVLDLDRAASRGFGLREMAKILLGSDRAEAFRNGDRLSADYARRLNTACPHKYRLWLDAEGKIRMQALGNAQLQGGE